jgi:ABC-type sugar transport system, ATPase component
MDEVFMLCQEYTVLKDGVVSGTGEMDATTPDDLIRMMVGRSVSADLRGTKRERGAERLRLDNFQVEGLRGPVDLSLHSGEIVGLSGLQGSGRSRLARGIFGDVAVTGGRIHLDGVERAPFRQPADAMSAGIAYVPEDRKTMGLALTKSVAINALMLNWATLRSRFRWISHRKEAKRVGTVIDSLRIRTHRDGQDSARSLSGGNQQKLVIAKWLQRDPRIVIFDEPTRGVDVGSKEQIYEVIRTIATSGATILLISSEMIELLGLSDRILVMSEGDIVGELDGATADEEQIMQIISIASRQDVV